MGINNAITAGYNQVSPQAFTNQNNIKGVFGQQVPNTFNRNVGQMVEPAVAIDPLTGQQIDPTMDQSPSMPLPPPVNVATGTTPNYEINNV